jgi:hypothetical protein
MRGITPRIEGVIRWIRRLSLITRLVPKQFGVGYPGSMKIPRALRTKPALLLNVVESACFVSNERYGAEQSLIPWAEAAGLVSTRNGSFRFSVLVQGPWPGNNTMFS